MSLPIWPSSLTRIFQTTGFAETPEEGAIRDTQGVGAAMTVRVTDSGVIAVTGQFLIGALALAQALYAFWQSVGGLQFLFPIDDAAGVQNGLGISLTQGSEGLDQLSAAQASTDLSAAGSSATNTLYMRFQSPPSFICAADGVNWYAKVSFEVMP